MAETPREIGTIFVRNNMMLIVSGHDVDYRGQPCEVVEFMGIPCRPTPPKPPKPPKRYRLRNNPLAKQTTVVAPPRSQGPLVAFLAVVAVLFALLLWSAGPDKRPYLGPPMPPIHHRR